MCGGRTLNKNHRKSRFTILISTLIVTARQWSGEGNAFSHVRLSVRPRGAHVQGLSPSPPLHRAPTLCTGLQHRHHPTP